MEKHSLQFKVYRMVSLSDVENLVRQLKALYSNMPRFEAKKQENLVEEVASLISYRDSASDWFREFSRFVVGINPDLKEVSEYSDTSVESLIKRASS